MIPGLAANMKHKSVLAKKEREDIFGLFVKQQRLRFSEIGKQLKIRSNHLNYHLEKMIDASIIEKTDDHYHLTKNAEKMIPFFAQITGKEQGPLSIITAAILNGNRICLLRREKRPYQGYWGMIGGKLRLSESIRETALREAKEETNLDCDFEKIAAVLHERVNDSDVIKHAFVIFLCRLTTDQTELKSTEEGELKWFDLSDLPEKIIPSDTVMIKELLDEDFCCKDVIIEDKDGHLVSMVVKDGGGL